MKKILLIITLTFISFNLNAANTLVEWTPPVERESCEEKDAGGACIRYTPLAPEEIGGYNIYYGTTQGAYNQEFNITDGTATSAILDLPRGFIYFLVVTTIDIDSRESVFSEFISVAVDHGDPKRPTGVRATVLD